MNILERLAVSFQWDFIRLSFCELIQFEIFITDRLLYLRRIRQNIERHQRSSLRKDTFPIL